MQNLSVLVIHNQYQQPGGEDAAVRAEVDLLRSAGNRVALYARNNSDIAGYGPLRKASLLASTAWNRRTYAEVRALIREHHPDIAHCHNFLPLVSPSAYYACKSAGVPVVQTLHNYRLLCPSGHLIREWTALRRMFAQHRQRCPPRMLPELARTDRGRVSNAGYSPAARDLETHRGRLPCAQRILSQLFCGRRSAGSKGTSETKFPGARSRPAQGSWRLRAFCRSP